MPTGSELEICILAGGLSSRMGRDKSRLRIGRFTMLGCVKRTAASTGLPVRVIRRDLVPRCGPLGGIYTALKSSRAERVLFLPCDMPFITRAILEALITRSTRQPGDSLFVRLDGELGFPLILPQCTMTTVESQIERENFSLQLLAHKLRARIVPAPARWKPHLQNINTPSDLAEAQSKRP
jgi:molybdenum cofactor guanylyltransferase